MENLDNNILKNKLSIGLALNISLDEYKELFSKYGEYIHDIYFSLPLGDSFHSRKQIADDFKDVKNIDKFYKILDLCIKNNIKLDCVLNRPSLTIEDIHKGISAIQQIKVDYITCLEDHVNVLKESFSNIPLIYSYNNAFNLKKLNSISKDFSTIVVGQGYIRNISSLKKIIDSGYKLKILLNNGCSYNCGGCKLGTKQCYEVFHNNLNVHNINYLYALQSFFPYEFYELLNMFNFPIETIKISNRTDGYKYLDDCLQSYIYNENPRDYIIRNSLNYRLWCRLAHFNPYLNELNYEEIVNIKRKLSKCKGEV